LYCMTDSDCSAGYKCSFVSRSCYKV
jgi:hypothetical protein